MLAIRKGWELIRNNGLPYAIYRTWHKVKEKTGVLRMQFPAGIYIHHSISLQQFKDTHTTLRIARRDLITIQHQHSAEVRIQANRILSGEAQWFHGNWYAFSGTNRWIQNPVTGYQYSNTTHWSKISSYIPGEDIKYVWDPARFEYLFPILHHDVSSNEDHGAYIFDAILSFIEHARIQEGPHYVSCQEMAIRLMHWCVFLQFYRDSQSLTEPIFNTICTSILTQTDHIARHLSYSRMLVRNNHVLSEAAALFTVGTLFPSYVSAASWRKNGWRIFEAEIIYQFESDGSYLQHAHNYHRMANRLITWMIACGEYQKQQFKPETINRIQQSIYFLSAAIVDEAGAVPMYGNNDGSNILPFTPADYADYRPSLNSLSVAVQNTNLFAGCEDDFSWFGLTATSTSTHTLKPGIELFKQGGYYYMRHQRTITFTRCHAYIKRPAHADNLHTDITYNGINLMRDAGVYQYNTDEDLLKYFQGTAGHNTLSVDGMDQMLKGGRFIWYYWTKGGEADMQEDADTMRFTGTIKAFRQSGKWITHTREIVFYKQAFKWIITDSVSGQQALPITQHWHPHPQFYELATIAAQDATGNAIQPENKPGHFAARYGVLEAVTDIVFTTHSNRIITTIQIRKDYTQNSIGNYQ